MGSKVKERKEPSLEGGGQAVVEVESGGRCARLLCDAWHKRENAMHFQPRLRYNKYLNGLRVCLNHCAVLASFLLGEELGHIGRVGCTLCLLGSLIIVLHAPEDKDVQTVEEILHYAVQPGMLSLSSLYRFRVADNQSRFHDVLSYSTDFLPGDDIPRCTPLRL